MRSYNNLYEPMLQDDYIKQCFINASKKKKNRNDLIKAGIRYSIKTESRSQRVVCLILWDFNFTMTGQPSGNQILRLRDVRQTISQSRIKSHGITHR